MDLWNCVDGPCGACNVLHNAIAIQSSLVKSIKVSYSERDSICQGRRLFLLKRRQGKILVTI